LGSFLQIKEIAYIDYWAINFRGKSYVFFIILGKNGLGYILGDTNLVTLSLSQTIGTTKAVSGIQISLVRLGSPLGWAGLQSHCLTCVLNFLCRLVSRHSPIKKALQENGKLTKQ
jgi:hypothetical protein